MISTPGHATNYIRCIEWATGCKNNPELLKTVTDLYGAVCIHTIDYQLYHLAPHFTWYNPYIFEVFLLLYVSVFLWKTIDTLKYLTLIGRIYDNHGILPRVYHIINSLKVQYLVAYIQLSKHKISRVSRNIFL